MLSTSGIKTPLETYIKKEGHPLNDSGPLPVNNCNLVNQI